jgi:ribosomal protein L12E/L44/L45/RPP1/RPP2
MDHDQLSLLRHMVNLTDEQVQEVLKEYPAARKVQNAKAQEREAAAAAQRKKEEAEAEKK